MSKWSGLASVYKLYDEHGDLLYVGVTCQPDIRIHNHQVSQWWGGQIVAAQIGEMKDRQVCFSEERRVMLTQNPRHCHTYRRYSDADRERFLADELAYCERMNYAI